jgi:ribonuclease Z
MTYQDDAGKQGSVGAQTAPSVYEAAEIWTDPGPPRTFAPADTTTHAIMLGSGKPEPTPYRFGPAGAVVVNGTPYLIDAGEGIWRAIAKAAIAHDGRFADALAPQKLTRAFLTHLHSDHIIGLPSLLLLPWTCGKNRPLDVHGPRGTKRLVRMLLEAFRDDIDERVNGCEGKEDLGWRAHGHDVLEPGRVYEDENVTVEAFHHPHVTFEQNLGYRFTTPDRTIVWLGDGCACDVYFEAARGADVLFSDVSSVGGQETPWRNTPESSESTCPGHIRSDQLADLATQAQVKRVVLHHEQNYSDPYDVEALAKEVRRFYDGEVISARDGDVF